MFCSILRCEICGLQVIEEEFHIHKRKKVNDYGIENNTLWAFDGDRWMPRKISPTKINSHFQHPRMRQHQKNAYLCP